MQSYKSLPYFFSECKQRAQAIQHSIPFFAWTKANHLQQEKLQLWTGTLRLIVHSIRRCAPCRLDLPQSSRIVAKQHSGTNWKGARVTKRWWGGHWCRQPEDRAWDGSISGQRQVAYLTCLWLRMKLYIQYVLLCDSLNSQTSNCISIVTW